ncbi:MAG: triose-phosphate isomerase [Thermodesulfovibrionales bacterium]|nr:triose-phosphate isomerase [Thermodesulfovibrionales bacterium]
MRIPLIVANWKMNKTVPEALSFAGEFLPEVKDITGRDILIAPPFTALLSMAGMLKGSNVLLSAQDVFYEEKGAYTGQISASMLKDAGCEFVIIGHSERRQHFGETDGTVNKKTKAALKAGLKVILCIGETLDERNAGRTFEVTGAQLKEGLKEIDLSGIVIAYEPVWAIGTGVTAAPEQAEEAHSRIREDLRTLYGRQADETRILYGGSVTPENVDILMAQPDMDGALVGGASLKAVSFVRIVKYKKTGG